MITNADVLDAINQSITTRWGPAADDPQDDLPSDSPSCQLCALFNRLLTSPELKCGGCPLALVGDRCFDEGTTFYRWWSRLSGSQQEAVAMRDKLLEVRAKFFGH